MTSSAWNKARELAGRIAAPPLPRVASRNRDHARRGALLGLALLLPGCQTVNSVNPFAGGVQPGQAGYVKGFLGGVATEDPAAGLVARQILASGGTAADAAVAAGFMLTVTLPSRAGIGGGGACVVYNPAKNESQAVLFMPGTRETPPPAADRPAAIPMMARGLFALQTTMQSHMNFANLIAPAEQAARVGTPVSPLLASDLATVGQSLLADPGAHDTFGSAAGSVLQQGQTLTEPDLSATLTQMQNAGVADLYIGTLAQRLVTASAAVGGFVPEGVLRGALPQTVTPIVVPGLHGDQVAFLPPPADGGLAAAADFEALRSGGTVNTAGARGLSLAAAWRAGQLPKSGSPDALLSTPVTAADLPPLPASTGLVVYDRHGGAVSCAFTMNNLFGTGRIAPGLGFLLAPAPGIGAVQPPLLSAAIAYNARRGAFRAAAAGSGQAAAPMAVAGPLAQVLLNNATARAAITAGSPEPGRTQLATCPGYVPGGGHACTLATDPRGSGVALGALDH